MAGIEEKQLFQHRPSTTSAEQAFSPGVDENIIIKTIVICNTTSGAVKYSLWHDDNGTTYDDDTVLIKDAPLKSRETVFVDVFIAADNESGSIAVGTDTANAVNFTGYGAKIT